MKVVLALFALVAIASAVDTLEAKQQFGAFLKKFNRKYDTREEFLQRFETFKSNLDLVEKMNARPGKATFGVTKFMDMSPEEFKNTMLMNEEMVAEKMSAMGDYPGPECTWTENPTPASSFDWRSSGAVTPVYNQAQCGSCWAFSVTEAIESQWFLAGNDLVGLSMQQIVSCDSTDDGCGGGWPYTAYEYVISAGGLESYTDYPYTSQNGNNGQCNFDSSDIVATISGYCYITKTQNETAMMNYISNQAPISVCVDAESWQFYSSGIIMNGNCGRSIDHCVMATGYGTSSGTDYWNVRNSWGTDWGLSGYLMVERGQNVCAIGEIPSTAIISS